MPTRSQIIATARAELGTGENPPGSNRNKYTDWYGWGPAAWCAIYTAWVYRQHSVSLRELFTQAWPATMAGAEAAKRKGLWRPGIAGAQPGDLVYFLLPGGDPGWVNHTGLYVGAAGGSVVTIDGNASNAVREVTRDVARVVGYIDMSRFVQAPPKPAPPAGPAYPGTPLRYDGNPDHMQHNDNVAKWQAQMQRRGWNIDVDGWYGNDSKAVAIEFQRRKGLDPDGVVGPLTWAATWGP